MLCTCLSHLCSGDTLLERKSREKLYWGLRDSRPPGLGGTPQPPAFPKTWAQLPREKDSPWGLWPRDSSRHPLKACAYRSRAWE